MITIKCLKFNIFGEVHTDQDHLIELDHEVWDLDDSYVENLRADIRQHKAMFHNQDILLTPDSNKSYASIFNRKDSWELNTASKINPDVEGLDAKDNNKQTKSSHNIKLFL